MKVVVVGAGVVGLCCAWYLKKDGHQVTVIDRSGADGDKCSLGNSGIVVPSHFVPLAAPGMVCAGLKMMAKRDSPFRIKPSLDADLAKWCLQFSKHCTQQHVERAAPVLLEMHRESRALYLELVKELDADIGFTEAGMLMLCNTKEGMHEEFETAEEARRLGLAARTLSESELQDFDAGVRVQAIGGVHYADDCHLAPHLLVRALQNRLESLGVTFQWNVEAHGWAGGKGMTLRTSTGPIEADAFVVATGSWSGNLAKGLGLNMPVQPGKGMSFFSKGSHPVPKVPFLLKEARIAVTPMDGAVRFGGTMELGEWSLAPDSVRLKGMMANIPKFLPDFAASTLSGDVNVWCGLRPCSPDGMPYIGRTKSSDGIVFATGHGMMGVSLGPATGKMVARALHGEAPDPLVSPDRFA